MMRTRKMNKTIVVVLAICVGFLISSIYFIPSNATETTRDLVVWGEEPLNPNDYEKTSEGCPQMSGYKFAGWYETKESTEAISDITQYTSAYPKFVDENVLTIKCQIAMKNSAGEYVTDASAGVAMVDVRLLTSVDNLQYQAVSFLLGTSEKELATDTVYKTVTGGNDTYNSADVCSTNTDGYLMAAYVNNLDSYVNTAGENSFERYIIVTPTWTTMDGTVVRGTQRKATVTEAPEIGGCEATFTTHTEPNKADGDITEILWYSTLAAAVEQVSQTKNTHVTIDVRKDATLPSHNAYTGSANYTYTLEGNRHILDASGIGTSSLFVCQSANKTLVVKNVTINHDVKSKSKIFTSNNNFNLELYDVTINSTAVGATEEALFAFSGPSTNPTTTPRTVSVTMDSVNVTWNPDLNTTQRAFIDFRYNVDAVMTITDSTFTGSCITQTLYWRNYNKAYELDLVVDSESKPLFENKVNHSGGAVNVNMTDYDETN